MASYTEAQIADLLQHQQVINYVQVASATLWVYEWLILIPDEVALVWESKWSFMTYLYMWTRYSAVIDLVLGLQSSLQVMSPKECRISDSVNSFLILVGIYTSELVLLWRTFAIWGNNKYVKYGLGGLWLFMMPFDIFFVSSFVASTVYGPQPLPGLPGCNLIRASTIDIGAFISLLVVESLIVTLTVVKGIQNVRLIHHGRLMPILTRDGVLFFICLLAISMACILTPILGPHIYAIMLAPFLRVAHSVLCCRVILHIRRAATCADNEHTDPHYSTIVRDDNVVFRSPTTMYSTGTPVDELESGIVDPQHTSYCEGPCGRVPLNRDTSYHEKTIGN